MPRRRWVLAGLALAAATLRGLLALAGESPLGGPGLATERVEEPRARSHADRLTIVRSGPVHPGDRLRVDRFCTGPPSLRKSCTLSMADDGRFPVSI